MFVKRVPDTESKIRIDHETNSIIEEGLSFVINPYDEYAVEEALRLKETGEATVTAFSVGSDDSIPILKKALAMGADEAVLLKDELKETYDGLRTARILVQALKTKYSDYNLLCSGSSPSGQIIPRFHRWWRNGLHSPR